MSLVDRDLLAYPRGIHPSGVLEHRAQRTLADRWMTAANAYGYFEVGLPSLAYAKTFAAGHSAAGERVYRFPDRSGRELTLVSDGFIAWVQAVCACGDPQLAAHRVSYLCPVHRYRKPRRRAFHQMGLGYLRLGARKLHSRELTEPLRVIDRFAAACNAKFTVQLAHPGMWRAIFEAVKVPPQRPLGQLGEDELLAELARLPAPAQHLAAIAKSGTRGSIGMPDVDEVVTTAFAELDALTADVERRCRHLTVTMKLTDLHAAEFHDGVAFQLFTESGFRLGDGGDYSMQASELLGRPAACVSVVVGYERVAEELGLPDGGRRLMVATLGGEPTEMDETVAADLRAAGWDVVAYREGTSVAQIRRAAQALGIEQVIVVGPREVRDGHVSCHNLGSAGSPTVIEPGELIGFLEKERR